MVSIIPPSQPDNNRRQLCRWFGFHNTAALEHEVANQIFKCAQEAINQRGAFHIVLAGGNTPLKIYALLRSAVTDWHKWHVYFGDERCLPAGNPERNSLMAKRAWLDHVNIPASQVHIIPVEQGAELAAQSYAHTLNEIGQFDLVLLGLGEDGHTASLFPRHEWGTAIDSPGALAVHDAPKPPAERVSLSAHRLSQSGKLLFLVAGNTKKQALQQWINGDAIPASAITPAAGVDVYLEQALLDTIIDRVK